MSNTGFDSDSENILFFGDPNLGEEGFYIHPSLPSLRGVGYDHIPLIENHQEHGATLHFLKRPSRNRFIVKKDIDAGRIIRTRKRKLSLQATYGDIRIFNQQIAFEMLEELSEQLLAWGDIDTAYRELSAEAEKNDLAWTERYIDSSTLQKILRELRASNPDHRVFITDFLLTYLEWYCLMN